jgi:hypothetical protein
VANWVDGVEHYGTRTCRVVGHIEAICRAAANSTVKFFKGRKLCEELFSTPIEGRATSFLAGPAFHTPHSPPGAAPISDRNGLGILTAPDVTWSRADNWLHQWPVCFK